MGVTGTRKDWGSYFALTGIAYLIAWLDYYLKMPYYLEHLEPTLFNTLWVYKLFFLVSAIQVWMAWRLIKHKRTLDSA